MFNADRRSCAGILVVFRTASAKEDSTIHNASRLATIANRMRSLPILLAPAAVRSTAYASKERILRKSGTDRRYLLDTNVRLRLLHRELGLRFQKVEQCLGIG